MKINITQIQKVQSLGFWLPSIAHHNLSRTAAQELAALTSLLPINPPFPTDSNPLFHESQATLMAALTPILHWELLIHLHEDDTFPISKSYQECMSELERLCLTELEGDSAHKSQLKSRLAELSTLVFLNPRFDMFDSPSGSLNIHKKAALLKCIELCLPCSATPSATPLPLACTRILMRVITRTLQTLLPLTSTSDLKFIRTLVNAYIDGAHACPYRDLNDNLLKKMNLPNPATELPQIPATEAVADDIPELKHLQHKFNLSIPISKVIADRPEKITGRFRYLIAYLSIAIARQQLHNTTLCKNLFRPIQWCLNAYHMIAHCVISIGHFVEQYIFPSQSLYTAPIRSTHNIYLNPTGPAQMSAQALRSPAGDPSESDDDEDVFFDAASGSRPESPENADETSTDFAQGRENYSANWRRLD